MRPEENHQLTLYSYWRSSAAYRVRIALHLKGQGGEQHAGSYLALNPQVYNAERYGADLSVFPAIREIVSHCRAQTTFMMAAPENQPDAEPL